MSPFDRVQIDAVFVHLPQGGHLAQTTDGVTNKLDRVVNLFLGGKATESIVSASNNVPSAISLRHCGPMD